MATPRTRQRGGGLERHAWIGVLRFAGSILVLSVAFKNIGLDFTPVMQALTVKIANSVEVGQCEEVAEALFPQELPRDEELLARVKKLEKLAHKESKK